MKTWVKSIPWFVLAIVVIFIDQVSKYRMFHYLQFGKPVYIFPFFNLTLQFNRGAAFSTFGQQSGWQILFLSCISIIVIIVVTFWLLRGKYSDKWTAFALALLLGGAAGNLIDRIINRYVIDFLDFHIGNWHYATFNIADSVIVVSIVMLILKTFFRSKSPGSKNNKTITY